MTLDSGDRIFFNITPSGMTLQVVSHDNLKEDDETLEVKGDCDTVQLNGREVALLLYKLTTRLDDHLVPHYSRVVPHSSSSSTLWTETLCDGLGKVLVRIETDDNVVTMKGYERDMFVSAIKSQAWRLFQ